MNFKNADNSWTAIGVVSYKHFLGNCQNDSTLPRPFTLVSPYLNWINCIISDGKWTNNSSCSNETVTTITTPPTTISPSTTTTSTTTQTTTTIVSTTTKPFRGCVAATKETPKRCNSTRSYSDLSSIMTIIASILLSIFIL